MCFDLFDSEGGKEPALVVSFVLVGIVALWRFSEFVLLLCPATDIRVLLFALHFLFLLGE